MTPHLTELPIAATNAVVTLKVSVAPPSDPMTMPLPSPPGYWGIWDGGGR